MTVKVVYPLSTTVQSRARLVVLKRQIENALPGLVWASTGAPLRMTRPRQGEPTLVLRLEADVNRAVLDATVQAHDAAVVNPQRVRVWDYVERGPKRGGREEQAPPGLDLDKGLTISPHVVESFASGDMLERIYYPSPGDAVADTRRLGRVTWTYDYSGSIPLTQGREIEVYRYNGEAVSLGKARTKPYSPKSGMRASGKRRANIIEDLKADTMGALMLNGHADAIDLGSAFVTKHILPILEFEEGSVQPLKDAWAADDTAWLDETVPGAPITFRAWLLSRLEF